jgi:hypothetical protein
MARRNRLDIGTPTALGASWRDAAIATIEQMAQRTYATLYSYTPSVDDTIRMLFTPDTIQKAMDAYGIVEALGSVRQYKLAEQATLGVNYDKSLMKCLPIKAANMVLQPSVEPLKAHIDELGAMRAKFAEAKHVVQWLDRYATLGAIRYYFPSVMQLIPQCPAVAQMQSLPSRHKEPDGISALLQPIRDAAATLAAAALLPAEAKIRNNTGLWLTFDAHRLDTNTGLHYTTDATNINIGC